MEKEASELTLVEGHVKHFFGDLRHGGFAGLVEFAHLGHGLGVGHHVPETIAGQEKQVIGGLALVHVDVRIRGHLQMSKKGSNAV